MWHPWAVCLQPLRRHVGVCVAVPCSLAACSGAVDAAEVLIGAGANVNVVDDRDYCNCLLCELGSGSLIVATAVLLGMRGEVCNVMDAIEQLGVLKGWPGLALH